MRSRVLVAAVTLASLATPASRLLAQKSETPQGQFTGSVEVVEVLLDALVTDKDGNVILGLGPQDFEVEENGQNVPVAAVSFYSNRRLAQAAPAALAGQVAPDAAAPDGRYFILFLEDQKRKDADSPAALTREQLRAFQRAEDWVRTELLPNDWVAVTSWDTRLRVQQDFTRDREALVAALRAAAKGEEGKGVWPSRATETRTGDEPSLVAALPTGKALSKATARLEEAVTVLAKAAATVRGRKNLILFSTGFGEVSNFGLYTPDKRYYPPMMQSLNTANVAVYGLDLTPSGVGNVFRDSINLLCQETGGRFYYNFTNFATPLRQIVEENNGYYLLSYTSRKPIGESGFQKVTVKVKNPGFQVKSREGYAFGPAKS